MLTPLTQLKHDGDFSVPVAREVANLVQSMMQHLEDPCNRAYFVSKEVAFYTGSVQMEIEHQSRDFLVERLRSVGIEVEDPLRHLQHHDLLFGLPGGVMYPAQCKVMSFDYPDGQGKGRLSAKVKQGQNGSYSLNDSISSLVLIPRVFNSSQFSDIIFVIPVVEAACTGLISRDGAEIFTAGTSAGVHTLLRAYFENVNGAVGFTHLLDCALRIPAPGSPPHVMAAFRDEFMLRVSGAGFTNQPQDALCAMSRDVHDQCCHPDADFDAEFVSQPRRDAALARMCHQINAAGTAAERIGRLYEFGAEHGLLQAQIVQQQQEMDYCEAGMERCAAKLSVRPGSNKSLKALMSKHRAAWKLEQNLLVESVATIQMVGT